MPTDPSDKPARDDASSHPRPEPGPREHSARTPENAPDAGGAARPPALRRVVVRPAASPDPVDAAFVASRLTTLTHDLANLLDGSLRVVTLARRNLAEPGEPVPAHSDRVIDQRTLDELAGQLATLHAAMAQMAELVRWSMTGLTAGASSPRGVGGPDGPRFAVATSLVEAIHHAVDVMRPIADESCIRLETHLASELDAVPAGQIYSVVVSAVRNAIEALQRLRATLRVPGEDRVLVKSWLEPAVPGPVVVIEISDNGAGVCADAREKPHAVFRLGYSTKPGGSGVGLAVSSDLVRQMGGTIELLPCPTDPNTGRAGAVLRVRYPAPRSTDDQVQVRVPAA